MAEDQQILPPDHDRISKHRAVVEEAVRTRDGGSLPGGKGDLAVLQRLIDGKAFAPSQTYELQSLGIVLGQVLAAHPGLAWVTVKDQYGTDPALRYRDTSILIFPLTMISKRVEDGAEVDVEYLYEATLNHIRKLETAGE